MASLWSIKLHYATVESGTSSYSEILVATVAALSGYGYTQIDVTHILEAPSIDSAVKYARGSFIPSKLSRDHYEIQLYPQSYTSGRDKVTDNITTLAKKNYLWLEVNTAAQDITQNVGTTTNYHATDYCIPVTIDGYSIDESGGGYKIGKLSLLRRYAS